MNFKKFFVSLIAAAAAFVACTPEEDLGLPKIEVNPTELSFNMGEGSQDVELLSTRDWLVQTCPEWVAVSLKGGQASTKKQTVTISVNANTGFDRSEDVVFTIGVKKCALSVKQAGAKGELKLGTGTLEDPFTVGGVCNYVKDLGADVTSPAAVYVKGFISSIASDADTFTGSGTFGNATFKISDDGSTGGDQFYCYRILYLGNRKFKSGDTDIKVGDQVIICGQVVNYKGNTPETSQGSAFLYELNGVSNGGNGGGGTVTGDPKGTGTKEDPYNVAGAIKAVSGLSWTSNDNYEKVGPVYVKGKVSKLGDQTFSNSGTYGNATFYITDDGVGNEFYCFRILYLGNVKYTSGDDVKVNDEVIICGEIMNYRGNTPETVSGSAYLYSLNGKTGSDTPPAGTVTGTVAETIAAADNSKVVINEALVAAISKLGLVVTDGTANVYIYFNSKNGETVPSVNIGDKVKVEATKATYGGVPEFTVATVTSLGSTGAVNYPEPKDITSSAASYAATATEFIKLSGKLSISGDYYNLAIDGVDSNAKMGSISAPLESLGLAALDGKKITVTGYFSGLTGSGKYINIVAVSAVPSDPNAKYCTVNPTSLTAAADATSASFNISANAAWTVTSDNADFTVSPDAGSSDATVTVSFAPNTGDAAKTAHIKVSCPDAGVEAVVELKQSKPSSGEQVTVTVDFTSVIDALPQGNSAGLKDGTYTLGGYEFILHAADKFYQAVSSGSYYLLIGKADSYVQLPVVSGKALTKVKFLTGAGASENVIVDVAKADGTVLNINKNKLKKGTEYEWTVNGDADTAYRLKVTNAYNAQYQNLTLVYE